MADEVDGRTEKLGGIALALAAVLALVAANSPLAPLYAEFLRFPIRVEVGALTIAKPLALWINDGLMALFFLFVGLEIKRELLIGELSNFRRAVLPLIAAVGGFVLPAAIFVALNAGDAHALRAWAVPTATDIAFVVGLIAALGRLVPPSLVVFVLAIAIIDDLMAVIVIALFYTANLSLPALGMAGLLLAVLIAFNLSGVRNVALYVIVGVLLWVAVLKSGVHATLAGVALGAVVPLKAGDGRDSPLETLEHGLKPWNAFLIVPVFAFANAGVPLAGIGLSALAAPLTLGIALGLLFGKQIGILAATWLAVRWRISPQPAGATWTQVYGVAILSGIGFTMSLFIGSLAFADVASQDQVRLGVLLGSSLSALFGVLVIVYAARRSAAQAPMPTGQAIPVPPRPQ